ncbi:MAG: response regulator [Anaerolineae bacterium]|nr:response regulator [Anaerolineae bacterium]MDW8171599.1 response regulator [Anaerolineae bacterium]
MLQDTPRILYIEDNPLNMTLVRKSLHFMGYRLLEAANGAQGINLALRHIPDLVLMDLHLPDISGIRVAARLRENPATKHVAIVALTADSANDPDQWCRDNHFDGYLTKPVSRTTLLQTVRYWADQAQQRKQAQLADRWSDADRSPDLEETKPDAWHWCAVSQHRIARPNAE